MAQIEFRSSKLDSVDSLLKKIFSKIGTDKAKHIRQLSFSLADYSLPCCTPRLLNMLPSLQLVSLQILAIYESLIAPGLKQQDKLRRLALKYLKDKERLALDLQQLPRHPIQANIHICVSSIEEADGPYRAYDLYAHAEVPEATELEKNQITVLGQHGIAQGGGLGKLLTWAPDDRTSTRTALYFEFYGRYFDFFKDEAWKGFRLAKQRTRAYRTRACGPMDGI